MPDLGDTRDREYWQLGKCIIILLQGFTYLTVNTCPNYLWYCGRKTFGFLGFGIELDLQTPGLDSKPIPVMSSKTLNRLATCRTRTSERVDSLHLCCVLQNTWILSLLLVVPSLVTLPRPHGWISLALTWLWTQYCTINFISVWNTGTWNKANCILLIILISFISYFLVSHFIIVMLAFVLFLVNDICLLIR